MTSLAQAYFQRPILHSYREISWLISAQDTWLRILVSLAKESQIFVEHRVVLKTMTLLAQASFQCPILHSCRQGLWFLSTQDTWLQILVSRAKDILNLKMMWQCFQKTYWFANLSVTGHGLANLWFRDLLHTCACLANFFHELSLAWHFSHKIVVPWVGCWHAIGLANLWFNYILLKWHHLVET